MTTPRLLVVWHSRTGTAEALAASAVEGARAAGGVEVELVRAAEVGVDLLVGASGLLVCGPENLGSMSGEMKEFVDRTYYGAMSELRGRPFALIVSGGTDGAGTVRQWDRIVAGWRLRAIAPPLVVLTGADTAETIAAPKSVAQHDLDAAFELGGTLAAGLAFDLW